VKQKEMIILDATSRELPERELNRAKHLQKAFEAGGSFKTLCAIKKYDTIFTNGKEIIYEYF